MLDLDPERAPFQDVVTVARPVHVLCEAIQLPCFVKTSGKSGLHLLITRGGQCTWDQARTLRELLARLVMVKLGSIATITRQVERRGTEVYLDYLQNRRGQLIVAPFAVRPFRGAPVSMPLHWKLVTARLDPARFTIRTAPRRIKASGGPLAQMLTLVPDLARALDGLARLA